MRMTSGGYQQSPPRCRVSGFARLVGQVAATRRNATQANVAVLWWIAAATWHGADVILGGYDNVELHGLGSSINCLGRRVTSYTTRDAKEIAKLLAMVP